MTSREGFLCLCSTESRILLKSRNFFRNFQEVLRTTTLRKVQASAAQLPVRVSVRPHWCQETGNCRNCWPPHVSKCLSRMFCICQVTSCSYVSKKILLNRECTRASVTWDKVCSLPQIIGLYVFKRIASISICSPARNISDSCPCLRIKTMKNLCYGTKQEGRHNYSWCTCVLCVV